MQPYDDIAANGIMPGKLQALSSIQPSWQELAGRSRWPLTTSLAEEGARPALGE